MSAHTPGPWEVVYFAFDGDSKEWFVSSEDRNPVAKMRCIYRMDGSIDYQSMMANAHLIAAAPKLLEALKGLVAWADDLHRQDPVEDLRKARAAIAKAKGGA